MYLKIFHIANLVFYVLLGISLVLLLKKIVYHIFGLFPAKKFPDAKQDHKFAILIPARNESAVIEQLLQSIAGQNYNSELIETYVIVESKDDPTCKICEKYERVNVFVREHLENKGKGYALDEVLKHIFSTGKKYEAFLICDADNILDKNFVREMNKTYDAGYKLCLGYRNSKNWNGGWVASCSALTFSMVNTFQNKSKARFNRSVIVSGTGFYISADILEEMGGWDFCTLTEDYEISTYSTLHNIKSTYNEFAEFYDEQPTSLKVSWNQRLRWCKGYDQVNKKYHKKLIKSALMDKNNRWNKMEYVMSILPVMFILASTICYILFTFGLGMVGLIINANGVARVWMALVIVLLAVYLFFFLYGAVMLLAERKHINITFKNAFICCLMSVVYWSLYVPIYISALFKKEVEWKPIAHNVHMGEVKGVTYEVSLEESGFNGSAQENTNN